MKKVCKMDTQQLLHSLKLKLAVLRNERNIIDVKLDEGEMVELNALLRKILSIGNKKVKNIASVEAVVRKT